VKRKRVDVPASYLPAFGSPSAEDMVQVLGMMTADST
jgi:hypothetical protein